MVISMWILISPPTPHPMPVPSADGVGGGHGGDINIHIDINMNIDFHIIAYVNIENYIPHWISPIGYSLLACL